MSAFEALERNPWDEGIVPFMWHRECAVCHRAIYGKGGEDVVSPAGTLHIIDGWQTQTRCGRDASREGWVWRI